MSPEPEGSPRRVYGRPPGMLGCNWPGSEGNLASHSEDQDQAVKDHAANAASNGQPETEAPVKEAPPVKHRAKAEKAEKPPAEAKAPPAETKAETKPEPVKSDVPEAKPAPPPPVAAAEAAPPPADPAPTPEVKEPEIPQGRAFDPRRRQQQGQAKNGSALDLVELKDMSIQKLNQIAKDLG